jgi:hypothetical protein
MAWGVLSLDPFSKMEMWTLEGPRRKAVERIVWKRWRPTASESKRLTAKKKPWVSERKGEGVEDGKRWE